SLFPSRFFPFLRAKPRRSNSLLSARLRWCPRCSQWGFWLPAKHAGLQCARCRARTRPLKPNRRAVARAVRPPCRGRTNEVCPLPFAARRRGLRLLFLPPHLYFRAIATDRTAV